MLASKWNSENPSFNYSNGFALSMHEVKAETDKIEKEASELTQTFKTKIESIKNDLPTVLAT